MNNLPPETEGQALRREFRETAWDLTRDIVSLPKRIIAQHYDYVRNGCDGLEPPAGRLRAAMLVARDEVAKAAGGMVGFATIPMVGTIPGILLGTAGLVVSNLAVNTALARYFWSEKGKPIFPHHAARLRQRAQNQLNS